MLESKEQFDSEKFKETAEDWAYWWSRNNYRKSMEAMKFGLQEFDGPSDVMEEVALSVLTNNASSALASTPEKNIELLLLRIREIFRAACQNNAEVYAQFLEMTAVKTAKIAQERQGHTIEDKSS